jgi:hypothetical protein
MDRFDLRMHEIRRRFVRGLLLKLPPKELRAYVSRDLDDAEQGRRAA